MEVMKMNFKHMQPFIYKLHYTIRLFFSNSPKKKKERKNEQARIPNAPMLLDNAAH